MAKPSKREQDMRRRGSSAPTSPRSKRFLVAVGVTLLFAIVWAAWPDAQATSRAANVRAFGLDDDPYLGDPNATVVLVGYESPHCSSCQYFHNQVLPRLEEEYFASGKVVYYYIQGTIGGDFDSSVAQECTYREGGNDAFWSLTSRLYSRSYTYASPDWHAWLHDIAQEFGLDEGRLVKCLDDQETAGKVSNDLAVGRERDARGTPTFWVFGATGEARSITGLSDLEEQLAALTN